MQEHIYDELVARGIQTDHHESDLYFPMTAETTEILNDYPKEKKLAQVFVCELDGQFWYEVPFGYMPFWCPHYVVIDFAPGEHDECVATYRFKTPEQIADFLDGVNAAIDHHNYEVKQDSREKPKYNGLSVGDPVIANGYEGTVTRLCEWDDVLIEVRLPGGEICIDSTTVQRA